MINHSEINSFIDNMLIIIPTIQVASIRQHLADIYERNQNWKEAANVLVGIPLETGQKYGIFLKLISTDSHI